MKLGESHVSTIALLKQADRKVWVAMAVILLVTVAAYWPALDGEFTNWDDQIYVTANPMVTNFTPDKTGDLFTQQVGGNIHPLTMFSLILNYQVSELNPFSYHLVNLLFHLANTFWVFLFLFKLFPKSPWPGVIAAMLFALHPLHVESVAWISERKDVLYTFFFLLGMLQWLAFGAKEKWSNYLFALLFFLLSLLSKPSAVVFPLVLFLLQFYQKRPFSKQFILQILPFLLLSIGMGIVTLLTQSEGGNVEARDFSMLDKLLMASYSFVVYLVKLVFPFELSAYYPFPDPKNLSVFYYLAPLAALGLGGAALWLGKKDRIFPFAFLFFLVNLILVLQIIGVGNTLMADRYTYLSSIGPFFLIGWGVHWMVDKWGVRTSMIAAGGLAVIGATFAVQTYQRCQVWENSGTLWSDVIEKYPEVPLAYSNRGLYYSKSNDWERTIADYQRSLSLAPNYYDPQYNLGVALQTVGRKQEAIQAFTRAITLRANAAPAYNNRGSLYMDSGNLNLARLDFDKSIEMRPGLVEAWVNRGLVHLRTNDLDRAMADLNEAIRRKPDLGHAYLVRSYVWRAKGNLQMARSDADQAAGLGADVDPAYLRELGK